MSGSRQGQVPRQGEGLGQGEGSGQGEGLGQGQGQRVEDGPVGSIVKDRGKGLGLVGGGGVVPVGQSSINSEKEGEWGKREVEAEDESNNAKKKLKGISRFVFKMYVYYLMILRTCFLRFPLKSFDFLSSTTRHDSIPSFHLISSLSSPLLSNLPPMCHIFLCSLVHAKYRLRCQISLVIGERI